MSTLKDITTSIMQGSGIGLVTCVFSAADLGTQFLATSWLNSLMTPTYSSVILNNLKNVETSNFTLNKQNQRIIVDRKRRRQWRHVDIADPLEAHAIAQVTSLTVLGITWTNGLSASEHQLINSCWKSLYVMRVLSAHGRVTSLFRPHVYTTIILN